MSSIFFGPSVPVRSSEAEKQILLVDNKEVPVAASKLVGDQNRSKLGSAENCRTPWQIAKNRCQDGKAMGVYNLLSTLYNIHQNPKFLCLELALRRLPS